MCFPGVLCRNPAVYYLLIMSFYVFISIAKNRLKPVSWAPSLLSRNVVFSSLKESKNETLFLVQVSQVQFDCIRGETRPT